MGTKQTSRGRGDGADTEWGVAEMERGVKTKQTDWGPRGKNRHRGRGRREMEQTLGG